MLGGFFIFKNNSNIILPPVVYSYNSDKYFDIGGTFVIMIDDINSKLYATGSTYEGHFGPSFTTNTLQQSAVDLNILNISAIAVGVGHAAAIGFNRTLSTWGRVAQGQLGNNSYWDTKLSEINLPPVIYVACGSNSTYVIGLDGSLSGTGANLYNGLNTSTFVKINNIPPVTAIYTSQSTDTNFIIGIDGGLSGWGNNLSGQLGDGTKNQRLTAVKINIPPVKQIAMGFYHTAALGFDGTLYTWGNNLSGQLGNGTRIESLTPIKINLPPIKSIACNNRSTIALGVDGTLSSWGGNTFGIGNGTTNSDIPIKLNLQNVSEICARWETYLVVGSNKRLSGWGNNQEGQLGDNTLINRSTPININLSPNVKI
jgi:alpha-tubulin suppressor-like RCC1 family protein